jgi:hypothetical protein
MAAPGPPPMPAPNPFPNRMQKMQNSERWASEGGFCMLCIAFLNDLSL